MAQSKQIIFKYITKILLFSPKSKINITTLVATKLSTTCMYDFPVSFPRCYKDVYVNSLFPHTARLWNSLHIECFPLI